MSIFSRLFGTEPDDRKAAGPVNEVVAPSTEALERKARSIKFLKQKGVPVMDALPVIEDSKTSKIRTPKQIAERIIGCMICAVGGETGDKQLTSQLLNEYTVKHLLTPDEKKFLASGIKTMQQRVQFTYLLDRGGVAVYDPQILKWWSPNEWRQRVFEPASPVPRHHAVILYSEDGDGSEWFHTRGMKKFGRPDLSMHGVCREDRTAVIDLFERFIEMQAFGALIPEGQEIRMRTLPPGLQCFHQGSLDDLDFNNVHIEIRKPEPTT